MVNNKDKKVFLGLGSVGLKVAPWKFDVLKTSILAREACNGKYLFWEHQISTGQLSANSSK